MAQATISARIDSKDKESFDKFCSNVGPSPRYNASDIEALKKGIEQLNAGKGVVHELSELESMEND